MLSDIDEESESVSSDNYYFKDDSKHTKIEISVQEVKIEDFESEKTNSYLKGN